MAALPFFGDVSAPAVVTRPAATVKFGAPAASSAGFGGILDAAASLLAGAPGDPWREHLLGLRLRRTLAPAVDVLELLLANVSTAPKVTLADEGTVALLGPDGKDTPVFKGRVDGLHDKSQAVRVVSATNAARELAQARLNRSFEQQDAGQIIKALCSELGLNTDIAGDVPSLPRYVIDDRASLYTHIARLAALGGLLVCIGADGVLRVKHASANGEAKARIAFAVDLLDFALGERTPNIGAVQLTGEGAAGDQGSDAWYWLRKDPAANQSTAGSGTPLRERSVAALRSSDAVAKFASAAQHSAADTATRGWLSIAGAPQVEPGDLVELSGMPQAALNGKYRADEIVHEFDARQGFRSRLRVVRARIASGGALGGLWGQLGSLL